MGGVGKSLDPDFDFISSAAPWVYEVKGVNRYLREETEKRINNFLAQVKECINSMADAVDSMVDTIKKVR
jgi:phosphate uptake regulator